MQLATAVKQLLTPYGHGNCDTAKALLNRSNPKCVANRLNNKYESNRRTNNDGGSVFVCNNRKAGFEPINNNIFGQFLLVAFFLFCPNDDAFGVTDAAAHEFARAGSDVANRMERKGVCAHCECGQSPADGRYSTYATRS